MQSWYAKSRRSISCYMPYVIDSPRSIELEKSPRFRIRPTQYGIIRQIVKWSTRPHGLFALPAALHARERTCHFKHCSYMIFTSNTDEIRGVSIVKKYCSYMYHFRRTFRYDFVNTYTCVKIRQHIVHSSYGHMVFYRDMVDTRN